MKICWDNLEKVRFTKEGNFKKGSDLYVEVDNCLRCGNSFLSLKKKLTDFCSKKCAMLNREISEQHFIVLMGVRMLVLFFGKLSTPMTITQENIEISLNFIQKANYLFGLKKFLKEPNINVKFVEIKQNTHTTYSLKN